MRGLRENFRAWPGAGAWRTALFQSITAVMQVNPTTLMSMGMAKVFKDLVDQTNGTIAINSLDFHESGEAMIFAADDESLHLIDPIRVPDILNLFFSRSSWALAEFALF